MKPQLLSTAALALLLTVGSAHAQTTKNEQHQVPQASTQNDSGSTGAARRVKAVPQKYINKRSTTGQASHPEQNAKGSALQQEMEGQQTRGRETKNQSRH